MSPCVVMLEDTRKEVKANLYPKQVFFQEEHITAGPGNRVLKLAS